MFKVGITGGIGTGKSTVTDAFAGLGIKIVDTDELARKAVALGSPALAKIAIHFGDSILLDDGNLNRAKLRNIVFVNPQEKQWLESVIHPTVRTQTETELNSARSPYAILSSPLLIETDNLSMVNRVVVIDVPEELQVQRAASRDRAKTQQIRNIMSNQIPRAKRLEYADDIIDNSGSVANTLEQVEHLHESYLKFAPNFK